MPFASIIKVKSTKDHRIALKNSERVMKPIRLSGHAKEQLFYRGTTEEEVIEAIKTAPWQQAELGRLECRKEFVFEKEWNKSIIK